MHSQPTKHIPILVAAITCIATSGCIYDDLRPCEGLEADFDIVNDWQCAPEADPEGMAYLFYTDGNKDYWRFDFPGREAGEVKLPTGDYRFIMFNDDTSGVRFESGDNETMIATTRPGNILEGLPGWSASDTLSYTREPVRICPDMMWSNFYLKVSLTDDRLTYSDSTHTYTSRPDNGAAMQLITHPHRIVATYTYDIINVENLDGVKRMCGAMSGLASSICINDSRHSPQSVTLPFRAVKTGASGIAGQFLTFGLPEPAEHPNLLYLFVWLSDGRRLIYEFDVTSQVVNAPDPLNVHVTIDSLSLPESIPDESMGTFDPSVDDWTHIIVNIVV